MANTIRHTGGCHVRVHAMTHGGPFTPPGVILSGGSAFDPCGRCNDGSSLGELMSNGWFQCPVGHEWEFKCTARRCGKTVKLREGKLICSRRHVLIAR
jgi:hypothetical protein